MSSPKKRSIREARLEKIERLLEEHEKSMFWSWWFLPSSSLCDRVANRSNIILTVVHFVADSSFFLLNCVFNLEYKRSELKQN